MSADHKTRTYDSILEMLSNEENPTPLVRLNRIVPSTANVFAKLEWYNPFGAVKDRIAANLFNDAKERGHLGAIKNLVEPTSGNTGLALTMIANANGFNLTAPLSSEIPLEKRAVLRFLGCDVQELEDTLCPAPGAPEGAIARAMEYSKRPGFHMLDQYSNEANPGGHEKTTGPEIWKQTQGKITHFVAALGTCGTITGVGNYLKDKNPDIKVIGIHPEEGHDIPGVRSLRQLQQTKLFRPKLYDRLIEITNREAFDVCLRLNREESIIAGPSSGLALAGVLKVIETLSAEQAKNSKFVVMFPDNIFKYGSSVQKHFPEMFSTTIGSPANANSKNKKETLLNKMIELARNEVNTINVDEASQLHSGKTAIFIDVRSDEQYQARHVANALHIPMDDLEARKSELPGDKNADIIAVCNRGNLSMSGMLMLKSLGYKNARSLNGGTVEWVEKGLASQTT